MDCLECHGTGSHVVKEFIHNGNRFRRVKPCDVCNGTGEVPYKAFKHQLAEITADDKNDELKLREHEKACV